MIDLKEIKDKLKSELNPHRYEHTMGVMYTAISLAMCYGEDIDKAALAGLLHDCGKCYGDEESIKLCDKYGVTLSEFELKNTALIHAKLGAALAKEIYGINDEAIISAIRSHTTGREAMDTLSKIVFIADYIEPGRDKAKRLKEIREEAFKDLDKTLLMILSDTLDYLKGTGELIDPQTQKTYDYYAGINKL